MRPAGKGLKPWQRAADPNFIGYTYKNWEAVQEMPLPSNSSASTPQGRRIKWKRAVGRLPSTSSDSPGAGHACIAELLPLPRPPGCRRSPVQQHEGRGSGAGARGAGHLDSKGGPWDRFPWLRTTPLRTRCLSGGDTRHGSRHHTRYTRAIQSL